MKVTRNTIIRFLQSERDSFYMRAQKYALLMANAEQLRDPVDYRNAERAWMQYEHYGDAVQSVINHLNGAIERGEQP